MIANVGPYIGHDSSHKSANISMAASFDLTQIALTMSMTFSLFAAVFMTLLPVGLIPDFENLWHIQIDLHVE